jgi:hypothetical protein
MADSTTHLDQLSASQANQEVRVNEMVDAMSVAASFGRRAATVQRTDLGLLRRAALLRQRGAGGEGERDACSHRLEHAIREHGPRAGGDRGRHCVRCGQAGPLQGRDERQRDYELRRPPRPAPPGPLSLRPPRAGHGRREQDAHLRAGDVRERRVHRRADRASRCRRADGRAQLHRVREQRPAASGFGSRPRPGRASRSADGKRAIVECDGTNVVRITADV